MRMVDGRYECTICGAILDVPEELTEAVEAAELAGCDADAIVVEGVVIHRCEPEPERGAVTLSLLLAVPVPGLLLGLANCV